MRLLRRFFHWLGSTETDREIKSGLKECMRFLIFALVAGSAIWTGAEEFNLTGEGRTTLLMTILGYGSSKLMR